MILLPGNGSEIGGSGTWIDHLRGDGFLESFAVAGGIGTLPELLAGPSIDLPEMRYIESPSQSWSGLHDAIAAPMSIMLDPALFAGFSPISFSPLVAGEAPEFRTHVSYDAITVDFWYDADGPGGPMRDLASHAGGHAFLAGLFGDS